MPIASLAAPRLMPATVLAFALLGALSVLGWQAWKQAGMAPSTPLPAEALASKHTARGPEVRFAVPDPDGAGTGPAWNELSAAQKHALAPLGVRWATMSEAQKRHWLTLAASFPHLSAHEQQKLQARITDWASLSGQQRSQARLNYALTNKLSVDDKRAQWEAYLALSEEERRQLAAHAAPRPAGAATAIRPISPRKLARVPAATAAANRANAPKIPAPPASHPMQALPVIVAPAAVLPASAAVVETQPVAVPSAVAGPLPPLSSASESAAPSAPAAAPSSQESRDSESQYAPQ
ncbi:putative transmembrane protein [Paracidovorax avenae ATCC 19860]|uniref:Putative transmembrane protein n=1 Tax=Paracidovorax avenae (strain ATCC 19860 / DSM 7227 / CCUG 15838 / JCM 20985 / LMG 2117 / NCPPB 1011) TaxID=643561 RepID=F0QAN8_PARA1|nr:DUF3106 domain-containing protein [Paracidovorax avenae]ADX46079.1 putative transmembrane protein [Paracidovorax avenae ATCC 19860]